VYADNNSKNGQHREQIHRGDVRRMIGGRPPGFQDIQRQ
jgi:hypothetical protein